MGGFDLVYKVLSDSRPTTQGKKWYRTFIVNAINQFFYRWRIYELAASGIVRQKKFRDETAGIHLQVAAERPDNDSRPGTGLSIATPVRYDGKGYYPQDCPLRKNLTC